MNKVVPYFKTMGIKSLKSIMHIKQLILINKKNAHG